MGEFFREFGRLAGPKVRKAKWLLQSLTGTEADVLEAEYEMGRDLACEVRRQAGLDSDPRVRQLVEEIGPRLAARVTNKLRRFAFTVFGAAGPNAFALPGGFIFVTRPMLDLCERRPDEVAFILGHEMAHVMRGHALDRILGSSALAAATRAVPGRGLLVAWLRQVGVKFLESAHSRERELEADTLGVRLIDAAGYDPAAAARLLSRLAGYVRASGQHDSGGYFASHPPFADRIQNAARVPRV
ncbi:MAG: M48 family metallopeptidase [Planctomycetes bacterium]|nr:M48 family metallopeptidase [Planctomycetota bacterium]